MALPVQSIRAAPEHRDVLQAVAVLLRQGQEQAAEVSSLVGEIEDWCRERLAGRCANAGWARTND